MSMIHRLAAAAVALSIGFPAAAQVTVADAWIRGTVAQQSGTGAFMRITSVQPARLVQASSPVAGVVEIHEMTMQGDVMRMRAIDALDLPAGRTVELAPGGLHVMLMDLKRPLHEGDIVPITLVIERGGQSEKVELSAPVRAATTRAAAMKH
jgi:hypothetical protein